VIFDHLTGAIRYVVIDTGRWLHSQKFIVPPDRLHASTQHEDDFQIDLTKEQIGGFPLSMRTISSPRKSGVTTSANTGRNGRSIRSCIVQKRIGTSHPQLPR